MKCPFCDTDDTKVVDSRDSEDRFKIRRRRLCTACNNRFSTVEVANLQVIKRSGVVEPFMREKLIRGVKLAFQGRSINQDSLDKLAHRVENELRAKSASHVDSYEIGLALLEPLRELDEVAYLRFASVYQNFTSVDDFEQAIKDYREWQKSRL
ncbi:MAG: transcriptional regulator NrdR [Bifidobacteriaceae bacterium]|jgi:transcriptional repressor NrdR|nr:transcriptional regulator NrdR [Bifidobacteriaceae bacterium]